MTEVMSMTELLEWYAYYTWEPFGEERADWRAYRQTFFALTPYRKPGTEGLKYDVFMPEFNPNLVKRNGKIPDKPLPVNIMKKQMLAQFRVKPDQIKKRAKGT